MKERWRKNGMENLEGLISRLVSNRVDFVVVGGFAAVAHGVSLLTRDVDICCRFSAGNLLRLQKAVSDLHPVHRMRPDRMPFSLTREKCSGLKNLYLDTDYGQLDCLGRIEGVGDFALVKKCSVEIHLDFGSCRVLSLDSLIKAKEAMGRPRDKEAVLQLKAVRDSVAD